MGRFIRFATALAVLIAGGVQSADATPDICTSLEAQLATLTRGADPGRLRQYNQTLGQQQQELDRAMAEARRAGCTGGFLFFSRRPEPKCGALMATINRMRANLTRLRTARDRAGGDPYAINRDRSNLLRALAQNNCGDAYAQYGQPANGSYGWNSRPASSGGFFASLFGPSRWKTYDSNNDGFGDGGSAPAFGTYRTLCVRTCDGYYFPISFSTVPAHFTADSQTCQAMCPGANVSLYIHRNPGENSDQMVSLDGQPYSALPTAFKYRQEYDASCTCHAAGQTAALGNSNLTYPAPTGSLQPQPLNATPINPDVYANTVPTPKLRPSLSEDPETLANRAGDFVPKPVTEASGKATASIIESHGRKVRVVGPKYFIAQ